MGKPVSHSAKDWDFRFQEIPSRGFHLVPPRWGLICLLVCGEIHFPVGGLLLFSFIGELHLKQFFIQSQCQMSIYYKYAPDVTNIVFLSYVDACVYWYTSEAIGKWFVDTLGKIFHMNLLGYAHCFMSIRIAQMKDHSISVD